MTTQKLEHVNTNHSKDVCAESVLDNTSFSYAVGNNTLSNTSTINDDTQNEQVCFDDDSNVSRFSLATWNVGGLLSKLDIQNRRSSEI